jgi:hypothetical protein
MFNRVPWRSNTDEVEKKNPFQAFGGWSILDFSSSAI